MLCVGAALDGIDWPFVPIVMLSWFVELLFATVVFGIVLVCDICPCVMFEFGDWVCAIFILVIELEVEAEVEVDMFILG